MLATTQIIWRELLEGSRNDRRRWPSLASIADPLGLGVSTVYKALEVPRELDAVRTSRLGGVDVLDAYKLLVLWAAVRRPRRDLLAELKTPMAAWEVENLAERDEGTVVSGAGAVVRHLGENPIATYSHVVLYGHPEFAHNLPQPTEHTEALSTVWILEPDPWLERYGQVATFAQAYVDLFGTPGWEAARFIEELDAWEIATNRGRVAYA